MRRAALALVSVLLLQACSTVPTGNLVEDSGKRAAEPSRTAPLVDVKILREGNRWTADFSFSKDAPVWIFTRSALTRKNTQPWRPLSWVIETPGVTLRRLGYYDAFVATGLSIPRKVRVRFKPFADTLRADYEPALIFTDGSIALYSEHYNAIPFPSEEAVKALPSYLGDMNLQDAGPSRVTFLDKSGPVLHGGKRHKSITLIEADTYVLFGKAQTVEAPSIMTVLDPQLPNWLAFQLVDFAPKLLSFYSERLGPRNGDKPTLMASWAGPTPRVSSLSGGALPSLILMNIAGEFVTKSNPDVRNRARWFIAHEASHLWLGHTIRYGSPAEAWITEGGADLLAIRAAATLDPMFNTKVELQKRLDQCVMLVAKGAISTAGKRSEHDAYYSCGAMFGLVAEAAAAKHGGDFFSFWRGLVVANRSDGVVTREDWLAELSRLTGELEAAARINAMLDQPTADATSKLHELFLSTGVSHQLTLAGKIELQ